jgi:hypothetical protein
MNLESFDIGITGNLPKLLETRLLITAGSGGGKSFLIRRQAETLSGYVQQIIFDYEGEFVTLREKFPFALVAVNGGDIPLNIRHAAKLAEVVMQTNLSVIIDLYDLEPDDRLIYMHEFLHALMKLPRELYHPALIYLDEIDVSCPQQGQTVVSKDIRNLAARGRKKGLCLVAATQRFSKVHKDVAAECQNKLVGLQSWADDADRAGEVLGLPAKERDRLRDLEPGHFFAVGPAFCRRPETFIVAAVATTHVQGGVAVAAPPTPDAIRSIVSQLKDLPEEAERDLESREQLQQEVARLKGVVTELQKNGVAAKPASSAPPSLKAEIDRAVSAARDEMRKHYTAVIQQRDIAGAAIHKQLLQLRGTLEQIRQQTILPPMPANIPDLMISTTRALRAQTDPILAEPAPAGKLPMELDPVQEDKPLGKCARLILAFLAPYDRAFTKAQVAIVIGYSPGTGGFNNSLGELRSRSLILPGSALRANRSNMADIIAAIGPVKKAKYDISAFKDKLGKCEREIYEVLLRHPKDHFSKARLATFTESRYQPDTGGFNNSLGRLNTLEIIRRENGEIFLNPELAELL